MQVDEDPVRLDHLRRQQFELLQRQATRSPFVIAIVVAVLAYVVSDHAPLYLVGLWGLVQILVPFARRAYALRQLRHPPADVQVALRRMVWYGFAAGLITGSAGPLFFPGLDAEGRALLSMILVCWIAGGVSTMAGYARVFYAFAAPALLSLALLWAMAGDALGIGEAHPVPVDLFEQPACPQRVADTVGEQGCVDWLGDEMMSTNLTSRPQLLVLGHHGRKKDKLDRAQLRIFLQLRCNLGAK